MPEPTEKLTEEQKRVFAVLRQPLLEFEPKSAAQVAAETKAVEDAEAKKIANAEIGQMIEGHGIFIGIWKPEERNGQVLGKAFNLFAAPEDLINKPLTFNEARGKVAALRNWHGHDGIKIKNDAALYRSLKPEGRYRGEWFIPSARVLLMLYLYKNKGALKESFNSLQYMSCTEYSYDSSKVYSMELMTQATAWQRKDVGLSSCRLVRAEPRPQP